MLAFRRRSPALLVVLLAGCSHSASVAPNRSVSATASTHVADTQPSTVTHISDGDTITLSGVGKVRLIGIDTPEVYGRDECFGPQASAYAKRVLAPGTEVSYRIGVEPRDRYGRALAYVYLRDGRMFNELLAEDGYATPLTIPPNDRFAGRFRAEARQARASGRGLWRACRAC
jgi:micrococcal nuclease